MRILDFGFRIVRVDRIQSQADSKGLRTHQREVGMRKSDVTEAGGRNAEVGKKRFEGEKNGSGKSEFGSGKVEGGKTILRISDFGLILN